MHQRVNILGTQVSSITTSDLLADFIENNSNYYAYFEIRPAALTICNSLFYLKYPNEITPPLVNEILANIFIFAFRFEKKRGD